MQIKIFSILCMLLVLPIHSWAKNIFNTASIDSTPNDLNIIMNIFNAGLLVTLSVLIIYLLILGSIDIKEK